MVATKRTCLGCCIVHCFAVSCQRSCSLSMTEVCFSSISRFQCHPYHSYHYNIHQSLTHSDTKDPAVQLFDFGYHHQFYKQNSPKYIQCYHLLLSHYTNHKYNIIFTHCQVLFFNCAEPKYTRCCCLRQFGTIVLANQICRGILFVKTYGYITKSIFAFFVVRDHLFCHPKVNVICQG